ncbi:MAG TPA: glycerol kinase, partial [Gammaproteobacteria bacterium]|nr:glycerol kinase [Gammaproteobacteria bacterium]
MTPTILSLDQGTTSSRAILFDSKGEVLCTAQKEFKQIYPQPGWVEHDAEEIWQSQWEVTKIVVESDPQYLRSIAGIGITNQRETTIVWDRNSGKPIYNAIVWQCRRTSALCDSLRQQGKEEEILNKTGLVLDPYFSATKIAWILENVPGARAKADAGELAFGTVDSWLLWNLTEGRCHYTDVSNASRTMLFNIHRLAWDQELLERLKIPESILPTVRYSSEIYGQCQLFSKPIPIASMIGDQQAATFAQACFKPGQVKNTYGTGCFLVANTGDKPKINRQGLLASVGWQRVDRPPTYILEGSVFIAGAVVQWLRDELNFFQSAEEIENLATSVSSSDGVTLIPAFAGLGAPYWNSGARGMITGLTRGSNRAHIARAALEAIALQSNDVLMAMQQVCEQPFSRLCVDGGASQNDLLMQIQSDVAQIPVQRSAIHEATALGAAFLAGLALGLWKNEDEILAIGRMGQEFSPSMGAPQRNSLLNQWQKAVKTSLYWAEK